MVSERLLMLILGSFVSIYALYCSWNSEGMFQKIITSGFSFAIFIVWLGGGNLVSSIGFFVTLGFAITVLVYAVLTKKIILFERLTIGSLGLFLTILFIGKFLHLPGASVLRTFLLIPLVLFCITYILSKTPQKKEFGFSLLIAFRLIVEVLRFIKF